MARGRKSVDYRIRFKLFCRPGPGECITWVGAKFPSGYGSFKHEGKPVRAHRIAYEIANGSIPEGMCVLHKCDVKLCVNPSHLFLGTHQDNSDDMVQKKRQRSKLTEEQIREIREDYRYSSHTQKELAEFYDVHQVTISKIVNRIRWNHVK